MKLIKFLKEHLLAILTSSFLLTFSIFKTFKFYKFIFDKTKILFSNFINLLISLFNPDNEFSIQILDLLNSKVESGQLDSLIPQEISDFKDRIIYSFRLIISDGFLKSLFDGTIIDSRLFSFIFLILLFLIPIIYLLNSIYFNELEFNFEKTSKGYDRWVFIYNKFINPSLKFIKARVESVTNKKYFHIIFSLSIFLYFNGINLVIDFFSYYFYFVSKFDFNSLWDLIVVIFIDLTPIFIQIPLWVYILFIYWLFCKWRKNYAINKLEHHEALNCGMIKGSGVMIQLNGPPGCSKTKTMTNMIMTTEMMFRQQSKEIMDEVRNLFPNFRWDLFRKKLDLQIKLGKIKNLVDCENYCKNDFLAQFNTSINISGKWVYYDLEKYDIWYNDALVGEYLFDVIVDYAKAYYVYQMDTALILSNYPIRAEHNRFKNQHMVQFDYNYFCKECFEILPEGYSKVVDYDMVRLKKIKKEDNPNAKIPIAFVLGFTELGKERGNSLENQELKKKSDEANQKNDGFTDMLRVVRHPATIRHRTFCKIFFDEQRASSCGIALSGITEDILTIDKKKMQTKNAMPFYFIRLLILDFIHSVSSKFLTKSEACRNDINLFTCFFSWLTKLTSRSLVRYINNYNYEVIYFYNENGSLPESVKVEVSLQKYFISYKKTYSSRYASDYLRTFFDLKGQTSELGIKDLPSYKDIYPTFDDIDAQNSYFGADLKKNLLQTLDES